MRHHFVSSEDMESLEQYLCALITGLLSIRSIDAFHVRAKELGILPEEIEEACSVVQYDIRKTICAYQRIIIMVDERVELSIEDILKEFQKIVNKNDG